MAASETSAGQLTTIGRLSNTNYVVPSGVRTITISGSAIAEVAISGTSLSGTAMTLPSASETVAANGTLVIMGVGSVSSNFVIAGTNSSAGASNSITWTATSVAMTTSSSTRDLSAASYRELNQALTQMHNLDDNDDWKIQTPVYNASIRVAAILMENNIPKPGVLTHGPKSVVFNWSRDDTNLYLTVSKSKLFVLASSSKGIEVRTELTKALDGTTDRFFSALSSARLLSPPEPAPVSNTVVDGK
jgi:hypothetical protein